MYTFIKPISLLYLAGLLTLKGYSQQPSQTQDTLHLTLAEVWKKSENNSRIIDIKEKDEAIKGNEVSDSKMERLPEWDFMSSAEKASNIPIYDNGLFNKPSQHEVIHTLYKVSTDLYMNLYNGNKLNLKIAQNKVLYQIAGIQKQETISGIKYKSASLFLDLQKSYIFRSLVIEDIINQEKQLEEIKAFEKNGTVLKSDVLRAQLDLSKRKLLLVQIENDILITNQKLNIIIGEPDDRIIIPEELQPVFQLADDGYETYLSQALAHSYAYRISEQETVISKIQLKQVKANVRPKLGLYSEFYYANPQIFLYPYNPYWYSLGIAGLRLSFPVSSLYHNIYKVKAAKLEVEKEEVKHHDTEDKVRQQVKEAFLRYKEMLVQIEVDKVNVAQAQENARIIKNTYFHQTSLITDLLDADVQVLQTKFELASAQILAQDKYYLLQNIVGDL